MINGFAVQPYPLECSNDAGKTWALIVGWRDHGDAVAPLVASAAGGLAAVDGVLYFRPGPALVPPTSLAPSAGRGPAQASASVSSVR